jgi:hypothetical protein
MGCRKSLAVSGQTSGECLPNASNPSFLRGEVDEQTIPDLWTTGRLKGDWISRFYQDDLHVVFERSEKLKEVLPPTLPDIFRPSVY